MCRRDHHLPAKLRQMLLHRVANRQLPYEAALESHSLAWRKIAEDSTYKVILADKR